MSNETTCYHISQLGSLASDDLEPDIDGYVHLTAESVLAGRWDAMIDLDDEEWAEEWAEEIAEANREATAASEAAIDDWRNE